MKIVAKANAGLLDLAGDLDVDGVGAVDHDIGDVVARQQRLEWTVAQDVVTDVVEQFFLLGDRHHDVLDRDNLVDDVADFLTRGITVKLGELGEIDRLDQRAENHRLDLVVGVRSVQLDDRLRRGGSGGMASPLDRFRSRDQRCAETRRRQRRKPDVGRFRKLLLWRRNAGFHDDRPFRRRRIRHVSGITLLITLSEHAFLLRLHAMRIARRAFRSTA